MKTNKCNHKLADNYKGHYIPLKCPDCGKKVIKGKNTPNKAFGRSPYGGIQ